MNEAEQQSECCARDTVVVAFPASLFLNHTSSYIYVDSFLYTDAHTTYIVQKGDTLAGIALAHGMRANELRKLNRCMYGSPTLMRGQILLVRGPAPLPPP